MTATAPPLAAMLRKLELWADFDDADRAALLALPHTLRTIDPHSYIVRDGDTPTHSCLLRTGFVFRQKVVGSGGRQILAIHLSGDMVDLQNSLLGRADHSVEALTRAEVAFIPREAVKQIAFERPAIGMALWYDTLVDASIFREWIVNNGRRDARMRIAHILCEFAVRFRAAGLSSGNGYELPMSQEQLADCTGLTPVHVNRTLRALERDGAIRRSRRSVMVADWGQLVREGDFRDDYLHLGGPKVTA